MIREKHMQELKKLSMHVNSIATILNSERETLGTRRPITSAPLRLLLYSGLRSDQLLRKRSRLTARAGETDNALDRDKTHTYLNNKSSKLTKGGRGGEPFNFDPRDIVEQYSTI
ncbi:unnamed protein product [Chrysodeixis includens]|uniref:Uncharacterized protein n=1 Tax=Chrysodeixis includens TaxID=689277 RepID=A0A9N8L5M2_CHRIL|nr:unnamed protein product [Chrysodeixis includens]